MLEFCVHCMILQIKTVAYDCNSDHNCIWVVGDVVMSSSTQLGSVMRVRVSIALHVEWGVICKIDPTLRCNHPVPSQTLVRPNSRHSSCQGAGGAFQGPALAYWLFSVFATNRLAPCSQGGSYISLHSGSFRLQR